MKRYHYPFSAIIGQEKMKTALLLNAVDPTIGGVLISGHKGTGKSTAVRALSQILPEIEAVADCQFHCPPEDAALMCETCLERLSRGETLPVVNGRLPVVSLPLSATEDRVVGTLHVEHALKTGERRFDPGLLAAANRGILYVDEVNLLDDHLVDILLDAAASGVNIVEREGISHVHPARFLLVGTMNPEEGELRPQFQDRFGLCISVKSVMDAEMRQAIARYRIAFDENPEAFSEKWTVSEKILAKQIEHARAVLRDVRIPGTLFDLAVRFSTEANVQGHRSDVIILKTAKALAAMLEKKAVEKAHVAEAARYALLHRITADRMVTPEKLQETLEELLSQAMGEDAPADSAMDESSALDCWYEVSTQVPGHVAASSTDGIFSLLEEKKKRFSTPMNPSASRISI